MACGTTRAQACRGGKTAEVFGTSYTSSSSANAGGGISPTVASGDIWLARACARDDTPSSDGGVSGTFNEDSVISFPQRASCGKTSAGSSVRATTLQPQHQLNEPQGLRGAKASQHQLNEPQGLQVAYSYRQEVAKPATPQM